MKYIRKSIKRTGIVAALALLGLAAVQYVYADHSGGGGVYCSALGNGGYACYRPN